MVSASAILWPMLLLDAAWEEEVVLWPMLLLDAVWEEEVVIWPMLFLDVVWEEEVVWLAVSGNHYRLGRLTLQVSDSLHRQLVVSTTLSLAVSWYHHHLSVAPTLLLTASGNHYSPLKLPASDSPVRHLFVAPTVRSPSADFSSGLLLPAEQPSSLPALMPYPHRSAPSPSA
jgi:hypothetical protein